MLLGLRFEIAGPPVVAGVVVSQETEVIDSERRLFTMAVFIIVVSAGPPRTPKLPAAGKNYENSTLNLLQ